MRSLLTFVGCLSIYLASAQSARDYFFPARDKNLSVYSSKFPNSEQKETRVFVKVYGDSAMITTQSNASVMINNISRPDTWEQTIKVSPLEIIALRGKALTKNGPESFDRKGETLFKIPARKGEVAEWSESNPKGAIVTIYRSQFATIKVDGKKMKAVKVSCIHKRIHSGEEYVFYVDYYLKNIGRYKTTSENGLEFETLAKQEYDPHVPVVN